MCKQHLLVIVNRLVNCYIFLNGHVTLKLDSQEQMFLLANMKPVIISSAINTPLTCSL